MPFDKLKFPEELFKDRREAVTQSLTSISLDELKQVEKQHQEEFVGDPWRDEFLRLMAEQPRAGFYRAMPQPNVVVYYCAEADFGFWVVPGSGSGPLDESGKRLMKEATANPVSVAKTGGKRS